MANIIDAAAGYLERFTGPGSQEGAAPLVNSQAFHPTIAGGLNLADATVLAPNAQQVAKVWNQAGKLEGASFLSAKANQGLRKAANATRQLMKNGEQRAELLAQLGVAAMQHGTHMAATAEHLSGWESAYKSSLAELDAEVV